MRPMATKTLLTLADYSALPDDGRRYELVDGEVAPLTFPKRRHTRVQHRLVMEMGAFADRHALGEVGADAGFVLARDPDTLRGPDVYFLAADRAARMSDESWTEGAPDIAVDVVSPSDSAGELRTKTRQYLDAGGREVWVVYPAEQEVHVFRSSGAVAILGPTDALESPDLLPGFQLPVAKIFR